MAHGENAEQKGRIGCADEYDSGRGNLCDPIRSRFTKTLTHRRERRADRRLEREALTEQEP